MPAIRSEIRRLAQQGGSRFACPVAVESVVQVSAGFVRVTVEGAGLADYRQARPADAFKVALPPELASPPAPLAPPAPQPGSAEPAEPGESPAPPLRAFTVRHFDAERSRLEFDVMVHGSGVVRSWLDQIQPGEVVDVVGVRREFHAGHGVTRHLVVGDSSALPAIAAIVESLDPGTSATVYLAVDHEADLALVPARDGIDVHWVVGGSPAGPGTAFERTVRERERERQRERERPGGRVQVWLAAETAVVRELRRWALDELGVAVDDLHAAAYWRADVTSAQREAVELSRYVRELEAGSDLSDPAVRERVELDA